MFEIRSCAGRRTEPAPCPADWDSPL